MFGAFFFQHKHLAVSKSVDITVKSRRAYSGSLSFRNISPKRESLRKLLRIGSALK